MVGAQLLRRNDEVSLLYEKMKIMNLTLHKGELQYKERLEDIRILKLETRRLRCKNNKLQKDNEASDNVRLIGVHSRYLILLQRVSICKALY